MTYACVAEIPARVLLNTIHARLAGTYGITNKYKFIILLSVNVAAQQISELLGIYIVALRNMTS